MSVGTWIQAARPKTLTAAAAPVLIGVGYAIGSGRFRPLPALAALIGAITIQIGTNFANDYYDFVRGGDTELRVGPRRVTQSGLIAPDAVRRAAFITFGFAFLVGVYLVWVGGWPIVLIGTLALLSGWAYTAGPFPLAYNGLGDIFVLAFFGPVAVAGTYWVQALEYRSDLLVAGLGVGALNTAILIANNLRDLDTDREAGKRTLPVILGRAAGRGEYAAMIVLAVSAPLVGVSVFSWPTPCLAALLVLLMLREPIHTVFTEARAEALIPALPRTARAVGVYGLILGAGLASGGW
jgi:1,4-dihydroxy-2-naphthoate octaprenyltransferase